MKVAETKYLECGDCRACFGITLFDIDQAAQAEVCCPFCKSGDLLAMELAPINPESLN